MENIPKQEFIKGSEGHLKKAGKIIEKLGQHRLRVLQDHKGIFSIEYPDFYLIANGYLYQGSILSAQREIIMRCHNRHKRLVVFIGDREEFHMFLPQDIIDDHWENHRGYLLMFNWSYELGEEVFQEHKHMEQIRMDEHLVCRNEDCKYNVGYHKCNRDVVLLNENGECADCDRK